MRNIFPEYIFPTAPVMSVHTIRRGKVLSQSRDVSSLRKHLPIFMMDMTSKGTIVTTVQEIPITVNFLFRHLYLVLVHPHPASTVSN